MKIPKHERICTACNTGEEEDVEHFLLICSLYKPLRQVLYSKLVNFNHQCLKTSNLFTIIITITFSKCPPILSKHVLNKEKLSSLKSRMSEKHFLIRYKLDH